MGKPKNVEASKIGENYNWGEFGGANASGVNLSPMATSTIRDTQSGLNQYVNELINPSYDNESFRARQELLDASNRQYANQLGAQAIERGARGSATQNILNSIAANRNMNMRQAMTEEDARVRNIINSLMGVESNYFGQTNTMADNILNRVNANANRQQEVNKINTQARNEWANNLMNAAVGGGAALLSGAFAPSASIFGYNLWGGQ
jgi:hypothetical protein